MECGIWFSYACIFSCLCRALVELRALPHRLHTYFLLVPLCTFLCWSSAACVVYFFAHSSHLNFFSAYGVCLGPNLSFLPRQVGICFCGFACCKRSHHIWDNPRGTAGHGPPAYATKQCTVSHYHMDGHQWNRCQNCTGAGASSHVGSCSVCKQRICLYLLTFYHTRSMPTPVWHVASHVF